MHKLDIILRITASAIWAAFYSLLFIIFAVLTLGLTSRWTTKPICSLFSRVHLKIWSIAFEIDGLDRVLHEGPGVFLFKHSSNIDFFLTSIAMPRLGMPLAKQELMYLPFINLAWWAFGFGFLKRGRGERSVEAFNRFAAKIFKKRRVLVASPEGTRAQAGELLPFKKGCFIAAMNAKVPIQFFLLFNTQDAWPRDSLLPRPHVKLWAKVLPAIPTDDWTPENLEAKIAAYHRGISHELQAFKPL